MGDVINLRLHRKRKQRADREAEAAENRAKFGQPKEERRLREAVVDLESRRLDGHRRGDGADGHSLSDGPNGHSLSDGANGPKGNA